MVNNPTFLEMRHSEQSIVVAKVWFDTIADVAIGDTMVR